jgi:penicillin-binding protein 1A
MMSAENAYVLKEILTEPVTGNGGTATTCWIKGMEVGAKTGSTEGYKDRWLCGITPYYAAATWFGFDYSEKPSGISGNGAAKLWGEIMRSVHSSLQSQSFTKPSGVVTAKICLDSGCVATESCTRTETEYFVKGTVPGACEGHTKLTICKETEKIATEYCTETEEVTYLVKPAMENTNLWTTDDGGKYDIPTETCDVHKAPEQVEVPNVVGKKSADAKKALEDKKLKVEIVYEENKNKDDGIVLKQSKAEKTKVDEGTTITITVNKITKQNENVQTNTITNTTVENTTTENKTVENVVENNTTTN